jgi:uncharacterized protein (TIGR04255 family)
MTGQTERRKYKKDFLVKVIARVDFDTPLLSIQKNGPTKEIYEIVKTRFPITEEKKVIGRELLISKFDTQEKTKESKEWHYYGKKREKKLVISPEFVFVEYLKYEYFEILYEDIKSVLDVLFLNFPSLEVKRMGLRYIDKIDIQVDSLSDWDKYVIPELNSAISITEDKSAISRSFHVMELNYGEDKLRFQFGMFNPDHPSPIKRKDFTLDFDMYTTKLLHKQEIFTKIEYFHKKLSDYFENVITDKLREIMEPLDEQR